MVRWEQARKGLDGVRGGGWTQAIDFKRELRVVWGKRETELYQGPELPGSQA